MLIGTKEKVGGGVFEKELGEKGRPRKDRTKREKGVWGRGEHEGGHEGSLLAEVYKVKP